MRSPWRGTSRRRATWFGLIALVVVAHALLGLGVAASVIGWNTAPDIAPIQVTLTQRLQPTAPPPAVAPATPAPAPRPARAVRASRASSQPAPASALEPLPDSRRQLQDEALALADRVEQSPAAEPAASAAAPAASEPASAPAPASPASIAGPARPPFQWPPSTRLTYTLTGEHNGGKLYGKAAVEWRHQGERYQVQFDIHITPMIDQHMASEGRIGADGLEPVRYDESFSFLFGQPKVRKVEFGADLVTLNNGRQVPRLPQTQDGASQFVQFVWMFYGHPETLVPGNRVQIPLALAHNLRMWTYEVVGAERLDLAFGALEAVHLKPILDGPRRANEYPFEIWTAPTLQYLPVQILVKTDEHSWALLALDDLPLQAAGERPAAPPPKPPKPFPDPPPFGER